MIGYLAGKIFQKSEGTAIILAGGVGYEVSLPTGELAQAVVGEEAAYHIYTHVREDILALYGFGSREGLELFKLLLTVSGIGPKVALAIISSAPIGTIKDSIAKGDPTILSSVSGVGKKTAEKAVVELRGKFGAIGSLSPIEDSEDIFTALMGLGFQKAEIAESFRKLPKDITGSEEKIKELIKMMGRK